MPAIQFDNVSVSTDDRVILHPFSLELHEHRIGIIGANGSGKSTLARLINGLVRPRTGRVTVDGIDVGRHGRRVRRAVGFIFSDADNQIVMPTVAEDVEFSLRRHKMSRQARTERVDEALRRVGLIELKEQSPHLLSGGEKQMLALASIMVLEPSLIVADEPTTLLDLRNRRTVAAMFNSLAPQLITVTHDLDLVQNADRIICLDNGRIVDDSADPAKPSDTPQAVIAGYVARMERG